MNKLLNKPFKAFTIYSLIILLCSIPAYYFVVDYIWLKELDEHNEIVRENIKNRFSKIQINDKELNNVLQTWNALEPGATLIPLDSKIQLGDSTYTIRKQRAHELDRFRVLSSYIEVNNNNYHLIVETNVEETDETMLAIAIVTFIFFILLITGFIILNKIISKNIWLPFGKTLHKLRSFDLAKDKQIEFEKSGIEEFEELNNTLDKLIAKNITIYNQQKIFIENASHELQTPLAILRSKMDMLLQSEHLTDEQLQILATIELPLSRMTRINKNLLLLAKIENKQFSEVENIDLSAALNDAIKLLSDYTEDKELNIVTHIDTPFLLLCNRFLLETLINNLLINAIRHTAKSGSLTIELAGKTLYFKNSGEQPLDTKKLFERFSISSAETTNSGLGLAIVNEICNRYNWNINYSFNSNLHHFSVTF